MNALPSDLINQMQHWRRHLHRHPELEFDVHQTADYIAGLLEEWGLEVYKGIGQSGVVGILRKGHQPERHRIALRADTDALPISELNDFEHKSCHANKMHACGHDGHTAMLLGAARYLALRGEFDGTVNFIFQPNEEHGLGAKAMLDDGLFVRFPAEAVYGMHNLPGMKAGTLAMRPGAIMASESLFEITVHGRGGHASSPHTCIDPVVVTAQLINSLQTIVSRSAEPLEAVVVSVTEIITDGARNVIPSTITLKGDCRAFSDANTAMVERRIREITEHICATHGARGEVSFSHEFLVSVNTPAETRAAIQAAIAVNGAEEVISDCPPKSFSEDFAHLQRAIPGCYIFIGNGTESSGGCMLHNPHYDFNDSILETGARYWCQLVQQQLPAIYE